MIQSAGVNAPPITEADAFTAVLNQSLDIPAPGVLRNDHDVEVEDTAPMHAQLVSGTTHGQLTFRADGSFLYVPNANYLGLDSFTYAAVDHFNAVGNVNTVTLTAAIKAVSSVVTGGATVSTGTGVTAVDPLQSAVTSPVNGTVAIAQGVISASQSPTGYTFLNQQVNITVTGTDGSEVTASAANPIRMVFTIDRSLIPAGQTETTFQMFRNGVLIPNCLGASTIPAANLDPCATVRAVDANNNIALTILTSHASTWNMGLSTAAVGDLPVARNDGVYAVDFQMPRIVAAPGVLGNDYGMHSLTAVAVGTPIGGSVVLASSGGFTFTPAAGFCGAASFQYQALDGTVASNTGTASLLIDCTPHAGDDVVTVLEDSGASTITVLSNDSDPDASQTLTITSVSAPAHGVAALVGGGMALSYAPAADFFGSDSFTYTISDGHNGTATATVTVTVVPVNDRPSFTKGANVTVLENAGAQTIAAWATGLSAGPTNEFGQALNFLISIGNPALFSAQPAIAPNGTLTFTGAANGNGTATVTVQLHDDGGIANGGVDTSLAQTFVINVTPVNSKPTAAPLTVSAIQGVATTVTLSGSDVETAAANLTYSVVAPAHGTVSGTAPNLSYKPVAGFIGPDSLTYTVTDGGDPTGCGVPGVLCAAPLASASATVSINVVKAGSTTALQSSANPTVYGTPVTLTATVTPVPAGSDVVAGSVSFMDGATTIGSAPVNAGVATLATSALTAGAHSITAVYSGDSNFNTSTSSALVQNVNKALATVTAGSGTKVYGTAVDPALSATTATGFIAADAPGIVLASTRASGEAVGSYATTATATGAALSNYTVTYVAGAFTITKKAATVTAGSGTKVYGAVDPALGATTAIGFTAADASTITLSSTRASGETVGTYVTTATATGAALSNYTVTYVAGTFSIAKASATITAGSGTKVYGTAADPALSATTATGFTAADAPTITLASTRASGEAAGSYATTATASGAALSNYTVTYVAGAFTITKKAATVTAGSGTKVYGTLDPALSATTATGFTAADAPAITLTATRASGEAAGNYATTATATGAALSNYTVAYVAGNFSIAKATASVTPNAASKVYGAVDPAFSGTLAGFLAADGVSAAYSRTAGESVAGGPYTISATLSPATALANYTITSNTAAFAITKAPLSVTANNASRVYNTPNPALSGTLTGVIAGDGITASYSTTAVTSSVVGSYPIVPALADPNGKLANYTVTSANGTLSVTPLVPTVTFTGAPASAVYRSAFTVAASTNSSAAAIVTASGACSISGTTVTMTSGTGACALTASWTSDANYTSATATQSTAATKATPVTTTMVSSATSTNYGQLVTLTATINGIAGGAAPSGTATFNDAINGGAASVLGSAAANGSAIYNTFALGAGAHSLTVGYGGDANYLSSASAAIAVTVVPVGIANLTPVSLNYSSQPVDNASMAMPVTLTNIGVANLAINNLQIAGDNATDFSISSSACGASVAPGASCVVNVKFKPSATGTRTASLVFTDNDNGISGSAQPISLVGSSLSNSKVNFTPKVIAGGKSLWFASELTLAKGPHDANNVFLDMANHPVRVFVTNGVVTFTANGINYSLPVPDALITFSPTATTATTTFDAATNRWLTTVPTIHPTTKQRQFDILGRIFASGVTMPVPVGGLPGGIKDVTWSAAYTTDTPGMQLQWKWGAAVYSTFSANYSSLQVKPADASRGPWALYTNGDPAGTPEAFKPYFNPNGGGTADDADDFTGDQTPNVGVVPDVAQATIAPIPVAFPGFQGAGTTSAPVIVTITNNHQTLPLIVSSVSETTIDFALISGGSNPCSLSGPTPLPGGASCTVGVIFSPQDMGTRAGAMNIVFSTPAGIAADEAPKPQKLDLVGPEK